MTQTNGYLPIAALRTRYDTRSSLPWGVRAFPPVPLIKIISQSQARMFFSIEFDGDLVQFCPDRGLVSLSRACDWLRCDWYLSVTPLWSRCDRRSSLPWGIRAFPAGPLVKIYLASAITVSGTELVCFFSQPSVYPKTEPDWVILYPKTKVLAFLVLSNLVLSCHAASLGQTEIWHYLLLLTWSFYIYGLVHIVTAGVLRNSCHHLHVEKLSLSLNITLQDFFFFLNRYYSYNLPECFACKNK